MTGGSAGLSLLDGLDLSGLTYPQLWLRYIAIGGTASSREFADQVVRSDAPDGRLQAFEHNLIAQALNEYFLDFDDDHPVGYRDASEDSRA